MTSNIDKLKTLCTNVTEYTNGEIWGYFGKFAILHGYNKKITIYEPTKEGWTHINYYLPNEYESAYNKLSEVILLLKQYRLNEKLDKINKDF